MRGHDLTVFVQQPVQTDAGSAAVTMLHLHEVELCEPVNRVSLLIRKLKALPFLKMKLQADQKYNQPVDNAHFFISFLFESSPDWKGPIFKYETLIRFEIVAWLNLYSFSVFRKCTTNGCVCDLSSQDYNTRRLFCFHLFSPSGKCFQLVAHFFGS